MSVNKKTQKYISVKIMFENIASKLQDTLYKIKNKGYITEKDLDVTLRDIRMTLLESDVNYKIVKDFITEVKEACLGHEVLVGLNPDQIIIKVEFTALLGLICESLGLI